MNTPLLTSSGIISNNMKRLLLSFLFILPFFAYAQSKPVIVRNVEKGIRNVFGTVKWNDHINILEVEIDGHDFALMAVNDKAEILWRLPLKGISLGCGKFNDKILVVTSQNNTLKGFVLPFTGHVVDVKTGKIELEKDIYNVTTTHTVDVKSFFCESGNFYKLAIRETQSKGGFSFSGDETKNALTSNLTIIDFNEKLENIKQINPKIDNNAFISMTANNGGDIFIASATNGYSVNFVKYSMGKSEPSTPIDIELDIKDKKDSDEPMKIINNLKLATSDADRNSIYSCLIEKNSNKEYQLTVNKVDFGKMNKNQLLEVFTKDHLTEILKESASLVEKYGASLGKPKTLTIDYLKEAGNNLIVVFSNREKVTSFNGNRTSSQTNAGSLVVNCYDSNIKLKFQTILPIGYSAGSWFQPSYHYQNNNLYIVATDRASIGGKFSGLTPLFGTLDLSAGKWKKLEYFDKSGLPGGSFLDYNMWYEDCFISPMTDYNTFGSSNITFYKSTY